MDKKVEATIAKYPKNKLISSVDMNFVKVNGQLPNLSKEPSVKQTPKTSFYIISESGYNEIANVRGLKDKIKLNDINEAVVFEQNLTMNLDYKNYIGKTITINGNNDNLPVKVVDFKAYALPNSGMIRRAIVVSDVVYIKYQSKDNIYRIKGYITDNKKDSEGLTNELTSILSGKLTKNDGGFFTFSSYYLDYKAGLTFSGVIIFIGAFLGLLFLAATGSIIFFKQLSEASDDKIRYEILRNIGVTNKEIKTSISKQIFIVFALPLVIGIMHSLVASSLLSRMVKVNLTLPIIITVSAYTVIYMIYYFLTVSAYYNIINSKG